MKKHEFVLMLESLAKEIEGGEIKMLDASEELRGLAYEAENIFD